MGDDDGAGFGTIGCNKTEKMIVSAVSAASRASMADLTIDTIDTIDAIDAFGNEIRNRQDWRAPV